ncbi:MAG TPA: prolyl oligopeptidase family serine peptidase [Pyrinomonadaceae bacterium]|nr:prolyl oligopeptidase family serine peptidase [Pyrinomonadaceae bacterium]
MDLLSAYGQFGDDYRYTEDPHYQLAFGGAGIEETMRFDSPPWKDLGRYLRNSPIFYVDRVQTPVMIIQGDMDSNAMQQAEEFFTALYRQGKRAELVRYWGEGHVISSEANVRDMWERIFAWFDEFSPKPKDKKPTEQKPN